MKPLSEATALVTGASSGIGRATAWQLLDRGTRVYGVSRRPDRLPDGVVRIQADLTDPAQVDRVLDGVGGLDMLVNAAGVAYLAPVLTSDPAEWDEMWKVNVLALARLCQLAIPRFPEPGGRIVNVSSMSGHRVSASGGMYAPTKFAVRALTGGLRHELKAAKSKVQVACVSPGYVDTPILDQYFKGREEKLAATRATTRFLDPEDVARAILHIIEAPAHVEVGDILLRSTDQAG